MAAPGLRRPVTARTLARRVVPRPGRRIVDLVGRRSQFVIATHSPILLAIPGATILQIDDEGDLERVAFDDAEPVALTRRFLGAPDRFLRYLLDGDE